MPAAASAQTNVDNWSLLPIWPNLCIFASTDANKLPYQSGIKTLQVAQRQQIFGMILMATVIFMGAAIGIGGYTFGYANGASYFSNRPEACANCHVMREVLQDWRSGDHHHVAVCNDCHVPQGPVAKWITKGINGFHHSYAFTFTETPVAIRAMALSRRIVQDNCVRCHGQIFADQRISGISHDNKHAHVTTDSCISCHRQVGHLH